MSFDNKSIKPVRRNKPHIVLRGGYWRVSPKTKPYFMYRRRWEAAYQFIHFLNFIESIQDE